MKRAGKITIIKILRPFIKELSFRKTWSMAKVLKNERPHWFKEQVRINTFFPPYPSKGFDRFFKVVTNKKRVPYQVYIAVTPTCPYSCPHCSYGKRKARQLSTKQMINLINQIKEIGTAILGFTGGEPMLRNDLEELIRTASTHMSTIIFTTGHKLDEKKAKVLAKAGIDCIVIGLESADPEKHDKVRGKKGSFREGIDAIKACKKAGIYTAIGSIGTRDRIKSGELERIYELGSKLGVGEIRLLFPVASGSWMGRNDSMLRKEELEMLKEFHINHNKRKTGPVVASFAHIESAEMFGCNAGYHHLFIDATGEVCPCDLTPLSFGNITKEQLKDVWEKMGKHFEKPRCTCLMKDIACKIDSETLPLPPKDSNKVIKNAKKEKSLPKLYEILFK